MAKVVEDQDLRIAEGEKAGVVGINGRAVDYWTERTTGAGAGAGAEQDKAEPARIGAK